MLQQAQQHPATLNDADTEAFEFLKILNLRNAIQFKKKLWTYEQYLTFDVHEWL